MGRDHAATRGLKTEIEAGIRVGYKELAGEALVGQLANLSDKRFARQLKGNGVGYSRSDLFVNDCVIAELKVAQAYNPEDEPQLLNEGTAHQLWQNKGRIRTYGL